MGKKLLLLLILPISLGIATYMSTVQPTASIPQEAPTVTGITPDGGTTEDSALNMTITGTGFESGTGLAVELNNNGATPVSATRLKWVSPTRIDAAFDLTGVTTNLGTYWDVMVTNPDGQAGTGSDLFTVYYVCTPSYLFKISVCSQSHEDYGLAYPVTYMFDGPSGRITVWHRHSTDAEWEALAVKTAQDSFNGIEAVRFDGTMAYVSVAFDACSDDIYLAFMNESGDPVEGVKYAGMCEYYDNRKAVVTMTNDDFGWWSTYAGFQAMWQATQSRGIWESTAVMTYDVSENQYWGDLQAALDAGYIEIASHTQTHPKVPLGGEIEASRQDIVNNLELPVPYRRGTSEYVPLFIAPHIDITYDDFTLIGESKYLNVIAVDFGTNTPAWATWNDDKGIYNPKWVSLQYELATEAQLNAAFDTAYASGGIYHLRGHPAAESTWESGKMANHLDYIKGKTDIWYVGYGAMYMYHYVQERDLATVSAL